MARIDVCPIAPDEELRCGQNPIVRYLWLLRLIGRTIRRLVTRLNEKAIRARRLSGTIKTIE